MKCVDADLLKKVYDTGRFGAFSKILNAKFNNQTYCFKLYLDNYDKFILDNIAYMTDVEFSQQYLTPLYVVKKFAKNKVVGCLSEEAENTVDLACVCEKEKQLLYLRQTKDLITNLHKDYKYIHGDLSVSNILVDLDNDLSYLCDFDSALRIGQEVKSYMSFSESVCDYLSRYAFDEKVDIYKFNLLTLALLFNRREWEILYDISVNMLNLSNYNKEVKRLVKELTLEDTRNSYSGEYIIDYID